MDVEHEKLFVRRERMMGATMREGVRSERRVKWKQAGIKMGNGLGGE